MYNVNSSVGKSQITNYFSKNMLRTRGIDDLVANQKAAVFVFKIYDGTNLNFQVGVTFQTHQKRLRFDI